MPLDFPEPTVTDLMRQLYGLLEPLRPDDAAAGYLRACGLPRHPALRVLPAAGMPLEMPDFTAHCALAAPLTRYDGTLCGLAGCWLDEAGKPAARHRGLAAFYYAAKSAGAAVRFGRPETHLGVAIDIETALRARQRFAVPCWAAGIASRLPDIAVPRYIERVTIFTDHSPLFDCYTEAVEEARTWLERRGHSVDVESMWGQSQ